MEDVTFNPLGGQPAGPLYTQERLLPDDVAWLRAALPGIRRRQAQRGLVVRGHALYLGRLESSARSEPLPVADCHPGAAFLFVDEHGRLAPCSFTSGEYGVPIRAIRCGADLAQLPVPLAETRSLRRSAACLDCRSTQVFGKFAHGEAP